MSIDLILCDLPYGTSSGKWDKVIPMDELWEQYKRIIKDEGAIVLFGSEPFSSHVRMSNLKMYKYDWKWNKNKGANFLNAKYQPFKTYEDIMVFSKKASSYSRKGTMNYFPIMESSTPYISKNGNDNRRIDVSANVRSKIKKVANVNTGTRYPKSILKFNLPKKKLHPTQKPVALLEYLIKTYTNEGDTVLDNCMGSGSTGVACVNTNRNFIGMELNSEYYEISKDRIEKVVAEHE